LVIGPAGAGRCTELYNVLGPFVGLSGEF
jgi:ABC-type lipopolysaccharide export system ATPase subunit